MMPTKPSSFPSAGQRVIYFDPVCSPGATIGRVRCIVREMGENFYRIKLEGSERELNVPASDLLVFGANGEPFAPKLRRLIEFEAAFGPEDEEVHGGVQLSPSVLLTFVFRRHSLPMPRYELRSPMQKQLGRTLQLDYWVPEGLALTGEYIKNALKEIFVGTPED
jgi:hypothetical protein